MAHISIDTNKCGSCHLCELACSFHHYSAFSPRRSSLEVRKHMAGSTMEIAVFERAEGMRAACDGCQSHKVPLCVQWCPTSAITATSAEASVLR